MTWNSVSRKQKEEKKAHLFWVASNSLVSDSRHSLALSRPGGLGDIVTADLKFNSALGEDRWSHKRGT